MTGPGCIHVAPIMQILVTIRGIGIFVEQIIWGLGPSLPLLSLVTG